MKIALVGNEPRQRPLFEILSHLADVRSEVNFDHIDRLTKWRARIASFSWPRSEWWESYQMHPLIQSKRQAVLRDELGKHSSELDALVMWGSWFRPVVPRGARGDVPYVTYVDQSRSLSRLPGEGPAKFMKRRASHALQAETYGNATAVLCMSEWAREQTLESHALPPQKVRAIGWGPCSVDLSRESVSWKTRRPLVLHISNDFHRKGVDWLLAVAQSVQARDRTIEFAVVGKLPQLGGRRLPANVRYHGPIHDRTRLEDFFRSASAFLLPHRFDRSPHVLVEAMSAGVPLVVSRQGGAIELVSRGDVGDLCEAGDIDAYANSVTKYVADESARQKAGMAGRALQAEYYNWLSVATRILQSLRES